ncbi:MAG: transposase [Planctomycetes bacterium]|nr:transposase [Planctomycetota bacterium]
MYAYRRMTPDERKAVVEERRRLGRPWHSPPHWGGEAGTYIVSAACYEHRQRLTTPSRLTAFSDALIRRTLGGSEVEVFAWIVLPSHYHVLLRVDLSPLRRRIGRLHNGTSTQWNREDEEPGRTVWHGFSDRKIRSEGHYYATINYIHTNAVKHGFARRADEWPWSSFQDYLTAYGRDRLVA